MNANAAVFQSMNANAAVFQPQHTDASPTGDGKGQLSPQATDYNQGKFKNKNIFLFNLFSCVFFSSVKRTLWSGRTVIQYAVEFVFFLFFK